MYRNAKNNQSTYYLPNRARIDKTTGNPITLTRATAVRDKKTGARLCDSSAPYDGIYRTMVNIQGHAYTITVSPGGKMDTKKETGVPYRWIKIEKKGRATDEQQRVNL